MKQFWNERYTAADYVYGTEPSLYFKEQLDKLKPGKLLLPAEGEGRNAVYAALNGWDVTAFDISDVAKDKAVKLAELVHVTINYQILGYDEFKLKEEAFDCIAFIFAHMHAAQRRQWHKHYVHFLKPGGTVILEAFSKEQIHRDSGGPKSLDMLYSKQEMSGDFQELEPLDASEMTIHLSHGRFHQGEAAVVHVTGKKATNQ
jgi:SAM-dependent methyltransferase